LTGSPARVSHMRTIWQSAQTYLDLYSRYRDPRHDRSYKGAHGRGDATARRCTRNRYGVVRCIVHRRPARACQTEQGDRERKYLDFMDHEWWITSDLLYSPKIVCFSATSHTLTHTKQTATASSGRAATAGSLPDSRACWRRCRPTTLLAQGMLHSFSRWRRKLRLCKERTAFGEPAC